MPQNLHKWADFLKKTRAFFDERKFVEVTTPHLVEAGAFEGVIDTLQVNGRDSHFELHSSPEIEMKHLIAETHESLYQICQSFRDDPPSPVHLKEFTMLEFYRVGATYQHTMQDMQELIWELAEKQLEFEKSSIAEMVTRFANVDLAANLGRDRLAESLRKAQLVTPDESDSWDDLFFKLWIDHVEPKIPNEVPFIVYDYPPSQSALGKLGENGWTERFEIYWKGMEICNGCTELRDADELRVRYEKESAIRNARGLQPHAFPKRLLEATQKLPPCSGVAVGLNRLFWAIT